MTDIAFSRAHTAPRTLLRAFRRSEHMVGRRSLTFRLLLEDQLSLLKNKARTSRIGVVCPATKLEAASKSERELKVRVPRKVAQARELRSRRRSEPML